MQDGSFPPNDINAQEFNAYKLAQPKGEIQAKSASSWTFEDPTTSASGYYGIGRLNTVAFHPTDANTFFVGSPGGGLWKTSNGGASWITLTNDLPVQGVSDIVIDPNNPQIMYIATGDGDGNADTKSLGVFKTTDGGLTWVVTDLSFTTTQQRRIRRLVMHPNNSQHLVAATSVGMYNTIDGGAN